MTKKKLKVFNFGPFLFPDQLPKLRDSLISEGFLVNYASEIKNRYFRFIDSISRLLFRIKNTDVVIIHTFGLLAIYLELTIITICKLFKTRAIVVLHGGAYIDFYQKNQRLVKYYLNSADTIIAPSKYLQTELGKLGYMVNYIPNTIDSKKFFFKNIDRVPYSILWVRAFHEDYQPLLAIEAFSIIVSKYPTAVLNMVGPDRGMLKIVKQRVSELGLENKVYFHGLVENNKLINYYNSNHVFLTTTKYESFGVAILEAARCKIPQVSTDAGEIPILWTDNEDILIAKCNYIEISEKLDMLFSDVSFCNRLADSAYNKSLQFDWEIVKNDWINIITK